MDNSACAVELLIAVVGGRRPCGARLRHDAAM